MYMLVLQVTEACWHICFWEMWLNYLIFQSMGSKKQSIWSIVNRSSANKTICYTSGGMTGDFKHSFVHLWLWGSVLPVWDTARGRRWIPDSSTPQTLLKEQNGSLQLPLNVTCMFYRWEESDCQRVKAPLRVVPYYVPPYDFMSVDHCTFCQLYFTVQKQMAANLERM